MQVDQEWAMATYDRIVQDADDAMPLDDSRKAFAALYAEALADGTLDAIDDLLEGIFVFDSFVNTRGRDQRRNTFKRDMEYILDALNVDDEDRATMFGRNDPVFLQAHALGDGRDKTLGIWTAADWRAAVLPRYRNAAKAAIAAAEFDRLAEAIAVALETRGLARTWDAWPS